MNSKNILITIGSITGIFILLFFIYKLLNTPIQSEFPEINTIKVDDQTRWDKNSKNILIEYSDFECPACADRHSFLKELEKEATPNAVLVFRNFPLYQIHKNALSASYAAEAAGYQQKYWEMNSLLFENQDKWNNLTDPQDFYISLAKQLNLNLDQFKKDMNSKTVKDKVQADLNEAEKIGLNSTPTFFLNGKKLDDIKTLDEFKSLLKSL